MGGWCERREEEEEEDEETIDVWILQRRVQHSKVVDVPVHFSNYDLVSWAYVSERRLVIGSTSTV